MKTIKKILIILLIISTFSFIPNMLTTVNASVLGNAINGADNFVRNGNRATDERQILNPEGIYNVLNFLYGLLLFAAIAFAVVRGTMLGMTIILGTIEERVDAKAMLVPYLWIVAGIAFGGTMLRAILQIIMGVFD